MGRPFRAWKLHGPLPRALLWAGFPRTFGARTRRSRGRAAARHSRPGSMRISTSLRRSGMRRPRRIVAGKKSAHPGPQLFHRGLLIFLRAAPRKAQKRQSAPLKDQPQQWRLGFDSGDDRLRRFHWIAWLPAARPFEETKKLSARPIVVREARLHSLQPTADKRHDRLRPASPHSDRSDSTE